MLGNPKYNKYCLRCFINKFPLVDVSKNYRSKELHVVDFIKAKFPEFDIITNKKIPDGCSLKRPDIMFDMGSHVVVIEVDEDQHNGYSCENKRMMLLMEDAGTRPMVFIRFNPDKYTDNTGNKIDGCWEHNHLGVSCVKQSALGQWQKRLDLLVKTFEQFIEEEPTMEFTLLHLFYDGFQGL